MLSALDAHGISAPVIFRGTRPGSQKMSATMNNFFVPLVCALLECRDAVSSDQVLNAFRPVRARGGSHRCLLRFNPERTGIVSETLVLTRFVFSPCNLRMCGTCHTYGVHAYCLWEGMCSTRYVLHGKLYSLGVETAPTRSLCMLPVGMVPENNKEHKQRHLREPLKVRENASLIYFYITGKHSGTPVREHYKKPE